MRAEDAPVRMDDLARFRRAGAQLFDHGRIVAVRDEADVLTVGLVGDRQPVFRGKGAGFGLGGQMTQREAQVVELFRRGREQEVGLIAGRVSGAVKLRPARSRAPLDVVPGGHAIGLEIARSLEQVAEFHPFVAADAGHGRGAREVAVGELVDHRLAKHVFIIKDIVGKPHLFRDAAGVVDVAARAAGALFRERGAMIVELKRDAHHVIAFLGQLRRDHGTVDAARHRHQHTGVGGRLGEPKGIQRRMGVKRHGRDSQVRNGRKYKKMRDTNKPPVSPVIKSLRARWGGNEETRGQMYLKKIEGPRAVTLPDGTMMTRADLPDPKIRRWVASRKAAVVRAVAAGLIAREEALKTYGLTEEEFDAWQSAVAAHGEAALKATALQRYRQP